MIRIMAALALVLLIASAGDAPAQTSPAPAAPGQSQQLLNSGQLDALVAPIALYPDPLISEVLMASTYPLEVVEAARWVAAHKGLKGAQLKADVSKQSWDESVKSLTATPSVLQMMNDKLEWTQKLGDAVLAQQPDVMGAIQRLRQRAQANNKLASSKQQTVTTQEEGGQQVIDIQPAEADMLYVPYYDPSVVYGAWPDPDYPPYYFGMPDYIGADLLAPGWPSVGPMRSGTGWVADIAGAAASTGELTTSMSIARRTSTMRTSETGFTIRSTDRACDTIILPLHKDSPAPATSAPARNRAWIFAAGAPATNGQTSPISIPLVARTSPSSPMSPIVQRAAIDRQESMVKRSTDRRAAIDPQSIICKALIPRPSAGLQAASIQLAPMHSATSCRETALRLTRTGASPASAAPAFDPADLAGAGLAAAFTAVGLAAADSALKAVFTAGDLAAAVFTVEAVVDDAAQGPRFLLRLD